MDDTKLAATSAALLLSLILYFFWTPRRASAAESAEDHAESPPHEPSITDVLVVKSMLNKALNLPPEIVNATIDLAEYWPHSTTEVSFGESRVTARGGRIGGREADENYFLLRSAPIGLQKLGRRREGSLPIHRTPPKPQPPGEEFSVDDFQAPEASPLSMLAHPCRRIVFTIRSHDQGWGGDYHNRRTYENSWTWFEAGLERWCRTSPASTGAAEQQQASQDQSGPSLQLEDLCTVLPEVERKEEADDYVFKHPLLPREDLRIQSNRVADGDTQTHRVVWSYTDDIDPVRDLEAATRLKEQGRGAATANGRFVRDLKLGDVVTVWAKARFRGWANHVESVKLDVYYAI
ncbi:uncharacterized protein B0T15DRAFT_385346 [Chaetomium strumarium]|uniref:Ankyrin repeat protein n=1 Tax=Chaetomium strumarium TaxID=1170767 RepID=A0AAJ0H370_9PEZI|nr:hypothetical protein B0T15DRAFT_385346 [Chaetomium strumarium]